jgi:predicted  nucleic acid-binding Zn-ribbon protein
MKKGKTLAVLGGLLFLFLVHSPATADPSAAELARMRQQLSGLKSRGQALKGQYNALEAQQRKLEAENTRLAARAPQIVKRLSQLKQEINERMAQEYYPLPINEVVTKDMGAISAAKWINELEAEQRRNEARRQAIPSEIAGIEQQKKRIRNDFQRAKDEYNRAKVNTVHLTILIAIWRSI